MTKNAVSGKPYSGANVLLLWDAGNERQYKLNTWLTYKQAKELGGHIKKGEKSVEIVYASSYRKKVEDDRGEEQEETRNFLKSYRVFNVEQTEGLPEEFYKLEERKPFSDRREEVEAFLANRRRDGAPGRL